MNFWKIRVWSLYAVVKEKHLTCVCFRQPEQEVHRGRLVFHLPRHQNGLLLWHPIRALRREFILCNPLRFSVCLSHYCLWNTSGFSFYLVSAVYLWSEVTLVSCYHLIVVVVVWFHTYPQTAEQSEAVRTSHVSSVHVESGDVHVTNKRTAPPPAKCKRSLYLDTFVETNQKGADSE